jgi:hypothetical protein
LKLPRVRLHLLRGRGLVRGSSQQPESCAARLGRAVYRSLGLGLPALPESCGGLRASGGAGPLRARLRPGSLRGLGSASASPVACSSWRTSASSAGRSPPTSCSGRPRSARLLAIPCPACGRRKPGAVCSVRPQQRAHWVCPSFGDSKQLQICAPHVFLHQGPRVVVKASAVPHIHITIHEHSAPNALHVILRMFLHACGCAVSELRHRGARALGSKGLLHGSPEARKSRSPGLA